jgi:hypothetical protein
MRIHIKSPFSIYQYVDKFRNPEFHHEMTADNVQLSPFVGSDTTTSPLLGPQQDSMPFFQDRPFTSGQMAAYPHPQHPLWGILGEDLMKLHEKQVAAKRERRKVQNRKA